MDERKSPVAEDNGGDETDKIVTSDGVLHAHEEQDTNTCNTSTEIPKKPVKNPIKSYLRDLKNTGPDRHIELLLTFVVAFFAGTQWYTVWKNNDSTTHQTDQLIAAAKMSAHSAAHNAAAAQSFAASAASINQGVQDAVIKLNLQASATKQLADEALVQANASKASAEVSKAAFEAESRPYVSVTQIGVGVDAKRQSFDFAPIIVNSGRTTAKNVSYKMASTISIVDASVKSNSGALINLQPGQTHTYLEKIDNSKDYARLVADGAYRFVIRIGLHYEWRNNQESSCTDWEYDPTVNMFIDEGTVVNDPRNLCPK